MTDLSKLKIQLFADGADLKSITALAKNPLIKGFTTNPSMMRIAGVTDYVTFAKDALAVIDGKPISYEVFSDDFDEMERQARLIAEWGDNVYVKIPVTNTQGTFSGPLIRRLAAAGVKLNVTALFTAEQVRMVMPELNPDVPSVISVFAGRAADAGVDPEPIMADCLTAVRTNPKAELLWASSRELYNIFHADRVGCHIITVAHSILGKLSVVGTPLDQMSLDTVQTFYKDAQASGFSLPTA